MDERPRQLIDLMVRTGFYDRAELIEIFCRERCAPGDLDPTGEPATDGSQSSTQRSLTQVNPASQALSTHGGRRQ